MQGHQGDRMLRQLLIVILSMLFALPSQAQTTGVGRAQSPSVKAEDVLARFLNVVGDVSAFANIRSSFSKGNLYQAPEVSHSRNFYIA